MDDYTPNEGDTVRVSFEGSIVATTPTTGGHWRIQIGEGKTFAWVSAKFLEKTS